MAADLAQRLVQWQSQHGRHDLPWQNTRDPYRVWLSEIMLQQTQVATAMAYYTRFLARFPNVVTLADAALDDVLGLWSGLGYYSRARNLHRCAQQVVAEHGAVFPPTAALLQTLPGIGRSSAAAVAALCFGERVAILDGNVKRVLTRVLGFEADLASAANERALWALAQDLLPLLDLQQTMPRYTQGVMDLGATLCTARQPRCEHCPLADLCVAKAQGRQTHYPVKTRSLKRSTQSLWLLWASTASGEVWLSQRPTPGVWAGLYCFPLFDDLPALQAALPEPYFGALEAGGALRHVLTHKDLYLYPLRLHLPDASPLGLAGAWVEPERWPGLGLPAPVRKWLTAA